MTRPPYRWPDADRDYMNSAFIPGAEALPPIWAARAAEFRAAARGEPDLPYGPGDRQRLDLFLPGGTPRGTLVFVHGGYWHLSGKADWSHLAAGAIARGFAAAIPGYTLAPKARIAAITAEIAQACRSIAARVPGPVVVTGHSAGGHLAARMGCADLDVPVARVVPVSPLAELGPLLATGMNATLRLDAAEVAAESPAHHALRPGVTAAVRVGGDERPAFLWQARLLAEEWGCPFAFDPGCHHFDVIDALADPESDLCATLLDGL